MKLGLLIMGTTLSVLLMQMDKGQLVDHGIGDETKQEREAIAGSVGFSGSLVVIACLLLVVTAAGKNVCC